MSIGRLEAMRIYQDYHCNGNTMHTSVDDMAYIVATYKNEIPNWQKKFNELDETVYDFDDDEFEEFAKKGKDNAKSATGYEDNTWDKTKQYGKIITEVGNSVGTVVASQVLKEAGGKVVEKVAVKAAEKAADKAVAKLGEKIAGEAAEKTIEKASVKAGEKVATEAGAKLAQETGSEAAKSAGAASFIIGCTLGAATAALYYAKRPNKDQVDAANQVNQIHQENQSNLAATQEDMQNMSEEFTAAAQEAEEVNEEANNKIMEEKVKYDRFNKTRNSIKNKVNSGKQLSESEKNLYRNVSSEMSNTGETINSTVDEISNTVEGIKGDMLTYQEGFDTAVETMGVVQGVNEYAAGFDESTRVLCYVEMGAQGLNAGSSAIAAYKAGAFAASGSWAFGATAWAWAFCAMGAAAALASGYAVKEQFDFAKQVGNEIDIRKNTEDFNNQTLDVYNVEVDNYDLALSDVDSLEIILPDDVSVPEDTEITVPDNNNKKPEVDNKKQKGNTK